jgi:hypothetical protein
MKIFFSSQCGPVWDHCSERNLCLWPVAQTPGPANAMKHVATKNRELKEKIANLFVMSTPAIHKPNSVIAASPGAPL